MSAWQWGAVAAAAVVVFWMLGAYNRLVALRNGVGAAWRAVAELLAARSAALGPLLAALQGPLAAEAAALDTLRLAVARVDDAVRAMGPQGLAPGAAATLAQAESAFGPACTRVLALVDAESGLRDDTAVQGAIAALQDLVPRMAFARQGFNDAVLAHNEAVLQWPTRLLSRLYGFDAASPL